MKSLLMKLKIFLMESLVPITRLVSKFHRPEMQITGDKFEKAESLLENGDILLSFCNYNLTNLVIPGDWSHVCVYYDGRIYESVTNGVRNVRFDEWIYKKDYISIVRPNIKFSRKQKLDGFNFLKDQSKEKYDFSMMMGDVVAARTEELGKTKSWFCSKYVYAYLKSMDSSFTNTFIVRPTLGEMTVTPQDYWNAKDKFNRIYNSKT